MFQRKIESHNFEETLKEIQLSNNLKFFDLSGTHFRELQPNQISLLFATLNGLPQPFYLKLNNCQIDENNPQQIDAITRGLSSTKKMDAFEFVRSISESCPADTAKRIFTQIAESLVENQEIKKIRMDGFYVIPQDVCNILKNHSTAFVLVNGLHVPSKQHTNRYKYATNSQLFFKPAANQPISNSSPTPPAEEQTARQSNLPKKQS